MICRQGSTLLLVLSVVFVLLIALFKCWKISSLRIDIQNQRENYYNRFYLVDNVLKKTIDFAVKNFDQILKSEVPVKIDFSGDTKILGSRLYGQAQRVLVKKKVKPDEVVVSAVLSRDNEVVCTIKCLLSRIRTAGKSQAILSVLGYTIL